VPLYSVPELQEMRDIFRQTAALATGRKVMFLQVTLRYNYG
jgi:hypothetical protein